MVQFNSLARLFLLKQLKSLPDFYVLNLKPKPRVSPSKNKIKTICFLTGRSRSNYRFFKLSRLSIRAYGKDGYFVGLSKGTW